MKKVLTFALALSVVASMAVTASAKQAYDAAKGTPTLDGVKDDCYTVSTEIVIDHEINGADVYATGTAYTVWDEKALYVYIDVVDPVISSEQGEACWQSDSVEVYVDYLNEEGNATTDVEAGQFTAGYLYVDNNLEVTGDNWAGYGYLLEDVKAAGARAHFEITKEGYICEMMLPWVGFKAEAGAKLGFTIGINDDADNAAGRENQIFPDDDLSNAWQSTDNYATLTLTATEYVAPVEEEPVVDTPAAEEGAEVVAPAPTSPKTADAGIVAAAAIMAIAAGVVLSKKH